RSRRASACTSRMRPRSSTPATPSRSATSCAASKAKRKGARWSGRTRRSSARCCSCPASSACACARTQSSASGSRGWRSHETIAGTMAFDLVLFGGTGDLAWRKLLPALFQAHRHGMLPDGGRILAIGRTGYTDDDYRKWLWERFQDVEDAKRPGDGEFARFAALLHYLRVDLSQPADYERLRAWVNPRADAIVFYLATSPHLFPVVSEQLGRAGLNGPNVRVVLEKPLGRDLESAQAINRVVRASFTESQALRIDHYVGKPAVQNLM